MLSLSESRTRKRCLEYSAASPEKKTFISRYFRTNKHLMIICELQGEDQISQSISVFSSYCGASGGRNTQLNWPQRPPRTRRPTSFSQWHDPKWVKPTFNLLALKLRSYIEQKQTYRRDYMVRWSKSRGKTATFSPSSFSCRKIGHTCLIVSKFSFCSTNLLFN